MSVIKERFWHRTCKRSGTDIPENAETFNQIKRRLTRLPNVCCVNCGELRRLQLDHVIPYSIKGESYLTEDFQLLCSQCHKAKTSADIVAINVLKKIGMIRKYGYQWSSHFSQEELIEAFLKIQNWNYQAVKRRKEDEDAWY